MPLSTTNRALLDGPRPLFDLDRLARVARVKVKKARRKKKSRAQDQVDRFENDAARKARDKALGKTRRAADKASLVAAADALVDKTARRAGLELPRDRAGEVKGALQRKDLVGAIEKGLGSTGDEMALSFSAGGGAGEGVALGGSAGLGVTLSRTDDGKIEMTTSAELGASLGLEVPGVDASSAAGVQAAHVYTFADAREAARGVEALRRASKKGPLLAALTKKKEGGFLKEHWTATRLSGSGALEAGKSLGIPGLGDVVPRGVEQGLGGEVSKETTLTIHRRRRGEPLKVTLERAISAGAEAHVGVGVGARAASEASISVETTFAKKKSGWARESSSTTFSMDGSLQREAGVLATTSRGVGRSASFTVDRLDPAKMDAADLRAFLRGDPAGLLSSLKGRKGELEIVDRRQGGAGFELGFGFPGGSASLGGDASFVDVGRARAREISAEEAAGLMRERLSALKDLARTEARRAPVRA